MYNMLLPIGSIVLLKGADKRLMVLGYLKYNQENRTDIYDYAGCIYPEGFLAPSASFVFNHEDIQTVYALGYQGKQFPAFQEKLLQVFKDKKGKEVFEY